MDPGINQILSGVLTGANAGVGDILQIAGVGSAFGAVLGGTAVAAALAISGVVMVVSLIGVILRAIAAWRVFTKMGEPGWKGLIPFYNTFTQYQLTWDTAFFWAGLALSMAVSAAGRHEGFFAGLGGSLCGLMGFAITVMGNHHLSRSFGRGAGFTVGLTLLNPIFMLILAFSGDVYLGNLSPRRDDYGPIL